MQEIRRRIFFTEKKQFYTAWIIYFRSPTQVLCFNFAFPYWILSIKSQWIKFRTRSVFNILTVVSELLVEFLKRFFSRPRPRKIEFFGGENIFVPLWSILRRIKVFPLARKKWIYSYLPSPVLCK